MLSILLHDSPAAQNEQLDVFACVSHMRVSPRGDALAFLEHPFLGDDRGSVVLIDLKGSRHVLTKEWLGLQGLAWAADGSEIWFTATDTQDANRNLYGVTVTGKQRLIATALGGLYLEDIRRDGRSLVTRHDRRYEVVGGEIGGKPRLLSWLQVMMPGSISRDGKFVAIGDWGSNSEYDIYLARLDGSPAARLGHGVAGSISPDNKFVTSILPSDASKVLLLPTGAGEVKSVTADKFQYREAIWAADGQKLLVSGSEAAGPVRHWVQDIAGGAPRPLDSDTADNAFVTVNGSDYLMKRENKPFLYPIAGGQPKPIHGLRESDLVIGGGRANDLDVIEDHSDISLPVKKLNIATGVRQSLVTLDESLDRLARLDPRQSSIVEMRFFAGLTVQETARLGYHVGFDVTLFRGKCRYRGQAGQDLFRAFELSKVTENSTGGDP